MVCYFENQRYQPLLGFSAAHLLPTDRAPFSDGSGEKTFRVDSQQLKASMSLDGLNSAASNAAGCLIEYYCKCVSIDNSSVIDISFNPTLSICDQCTCKHGDVGESHNQQNSKVERGEQVHHKLPP
jgi:hypothetical protein